MPGIPKAQYRRPTTPELLSEIATSQDGDHDYPGLRTGRSYTKRKCGATRKELRKQEREQKKKRRVHFHSKGHTDEPDSDKALKKGKANAQSTSAKTPVPKRSASKKPEPETEAAKKARRVQKLAEQNPHFFSTLDVDQILTMGGDPQLRQAPGTNASDILAEEERERRYLEKKLGIKASESGKITSGMKADGLDYLLGNFDSDGSNDQAGGINIEHIESEEYDTDPSLDADDGFTSDAGREPENDGTEAEIVTDLGDTPFT
ncbi:hypothetical protein H4R35_006147, partial [Dimargaris xerosporica]